MGENDPSVRQMWHFVDEDEDDDEDNSAYSDYEWLLVQPGLQHQDAAQSPIVGPSSGVIMEHRNHKEVSSVPLHHRSHSPCPQTLPAQAQPPRLCTLPSDEISSLFSRIAIKEEDLYVCESVQFWLGPHYGMWPPSMPVNMPGISVEDVRRILLLTAENNVNDALLVDVGKCLSFMND